MACVDRCMETLGAIGVVVGIALLLGGWAYMLGNDHGYTTAFNYCLESK
jgi:uncharacterized membrane protein YkgB